MANGGMGDCLIGIICSLAGQKYDLIQSASIGAYLHGKIADELVKSQYIVNATDIIDNISKYINKIFYVNLKILKKYLKKQRKCSTITLWVISQ